MRFLLQTFDIDTIIKWRGDDQYFVQKIPILNFSILNFEALIFEIEALL